MSWFSSSPKGISLKQLDELLDDITLLDAREKEYVKGFFFQYRQGGISKEEVEKAVRDMKAYIPDSIDRSEAEAIRDRLLAFLS